MVEAFRYCIRYAFSFFILLEAACSITQLRGFFVEVGVEDGKGQAVVLRSFVSSVPLENYSYCVRLPEE